MKKILIFSSGSELYGSERGLLNLIEAIRGEYEITVVVPRQGPLQKMLKRKNVSIFVFPLSILTFSWSPIYYLLAPVLFLLDMVFFTGYVLLKKIDLLYTNNLLLVFPSLVASFTRKKHIWHLREFFPSRGVNRMLIGIAQATRSTVVCMSRNIRDVLFSTEKRKAIPIIYEGMVSPAPMDLSPFEEEQPSLPPDAVIFAVVARIHPSKGQLELVRMMHEVGKTVPRKFALLIVGDVAPCDWRAKAYKKKIERYLRENSMESVVFFCGLQTHVAGILKKVDVCVFPFRRNEPFGLAFLEALVLSQRILITMNPGSAEILDYFQERHCKDLSPASIEDEIMAGKRSAATPLIPGVFQFETYQHNIRKLLKELA